MMRFWEKIENPLDRPEAMKTFLDIYVNQDSFYRGLTKRAEKKYHKGEYYVRDFDEFQAMLFNRWKNSVVSMSKKEYVSLYQKGKLNEDFINMRRYFMSIGDASSAKEVLDIVYGPKSDKELARAIENYFWTRLGEGTGWVHVKQKYVDLRSDKSFKVEERLYINSESIFTYRLVIEFLKKCEGKGLPYYFKFDAYGNRDDTVVIYTSYELLRDYLSILDEIKRENPEIGANILEPPLLTGRIDGWIGIGSEPFQDDSSFNELRADIISESFQKVTRDWVKLHHDMTVKYQGRLMSFMDYLALKVTEKVFEELDGRWKRAHKKDDLEERLGYNDKDLANPKFKDYLYSKIRNNLSLLFSGKDEDFTEFSVDLHHGRKVDVSPAKIDNTLKRELPRIAHNDANFIGQVRKEIGKRSLQNGIDSDMFCFNIGAIKSIKKAFGVFEKSTMDDVVRDIEKNIEICMAKGEEAAANRYRHLLNVVLGEWDEEKKEETSNSVDFEELARNIESAIETASEAHDYEKLAELKQQQAIILEAQKHSSNYEEMVAYLEAMVENSQSGQDYVARATWMQLLDIAKNAKAKNL